jgi:hypothetical protein
MINPSKFVGKNSDEERINISGSFFCEKCGEKSTTALMLIESRQIIWNCLCGENEASI